MMFTGIVQCVGRIVDTKPFADGLRIVVETDFGAIDEVKKGDSICVAGCCLTAVGIEDGRLSFDVSAETLSCTAGLDRPGRVNIEPALRLSDRLGGHLVSGHVDGVGSVVRTETVGDSEGSRLLEIEAPTALLCFIAPKGSIAVDGVSLTVNALTERGFAANLIPHTLHVTTLGELTPGARVNLEIDLVARYIERFVSSRL